MIIDSLRYNPSMSAKKNTRNRCSWGLPLANREKSVPVRGHETSGGPVGGHFPKNKSMIERVPGAP